MNTTSDIKTRHESNKRMLSIKAQLKELNKAIEILNHKLK